MEVATRQGPLIDWYAPALSAGCFDPAQDAFEEAQKIFAQKLTQDEQKKVLANGQTTMQDLIALTTDAQKTWKAKRPDGKAWSLLSSFSSRLFHYGAVLDVISQHHPEYVALAWGAIKFLFMGVLQMEELTTTLSKALCKVASNLPRTNFVATLYPTPQIKLAVANLYAYIMRFLIRAIEWYKESRFKNMLHAITQPAPIRYKDLLEAIETCSREVDQCAITAMQAEIRDVHLMLQKTHTGVVDSRTASQKTEANMESLQQIVKSMVPQLEQLLNIQTVQSSALLDTNHRVIDVQFSHIMSFLSNVPFVDPADSLRFGILMRNRHFARARGTPTFWGSPILARWTASNDSAVVVLKSRYHQRTDAKDFAVCIIEKLREEAVPVLWVLKDKIGDKATSGSAVDLIKALSLQAMRLKQSFTTEKTAAINCARIQSATTEAEWLDILASFLEQLPLVYVLFDVDALSPDFPVLQCDFSWPKAFLSISQNLARRASPTVLKVLFICYGRADYMDMPDSFTPADTTVTVSSGTRSGNSGSYQAPKSSNSRFRNQTRTLSRRLAVR